MLVPHEQQHRERDREDRQPAKRHDQVVVGRRHFERHDEQRDREAEHRVAEAFETRYLAGNGRERMRA